MKAARTREENCYEDLALSTRIRRATSGLQMAGTGIDVVGWERQSLIGFEPTQPGADLATGSDVPSPTPAAAGARVYADVRRGAVGRVPLANRVRENRLSLHLLAMQKHVERSRPVQLLSRPGGW